VAAAEQHAVRQELELGAARVIDLVRSELYAKVATERDAELGAREEQARGDWEGTERARSSALRSLLDARTARLAVERHRDDWAASRDREQETAEEQAALERWNTERFGPGRR
jgi:hypothetical protein